MNGLIAVAIIGAGDGEATRASLASQSGVDSIACRLPCVAGRADFDPAALTAFLEADAALAELVIFTPAGALFYPGGLAFLASAAIEAKPATIAYADYVLSDPEGSSSPIALPAFSYERMLEQGYAAMTFAMPRSAALAAARRGADDLYSVFFSALDPLPPQEQRVAHAAGFVASVPAPDREEGARRLAAAAATHLRSRGVAVSLTRTTGSRWMPSVRVRRKVRHPSVSVIIPTRDRLDLLKRCVDSIAGALELAEAS